MKALAERLNTDVDRRTVLEHGIAVAAATAAPAGLLHLGSTLPVAEQLLFAVLPPVAVAVATRVTAADATALLVAVLMVAAAYMAVSPFTLNGYTPSMPVAFISSVVFTTPAFIVYDLVRRAVRVVAGGRPPRQVDAAGDAGD